MYPYGVQDKKSLNMLILEILEQYSDSEHRLTQMEIVELLGVQAPDGQEQYYSVEGHGV